VAAAVKDGYKITHKGLLVWSPIPSEADVPRFGILFLAIEAAFSFLFWAMQSRIADHSMISCCPWPLSSFTYAGLCSHSPLLEGRRNVDLSVEQLAAMAAQVKEKKRIHNAHQHQSLKTRDPQRHKARAAKKAANFRRNSPDKRRAILQRHEKKVKASKKFYCSTCEVACANQWELNRHDGSERHLLKVSGPKKLPDKNRADQERWKIETKASKRFYCSTCEVACTCQWELTRHNGSKRHLQKVAAAESGSRSA
jgi:hypothetical protein